MTTNSILQNTNKIKKIWEGQKMWWKICEALYPLSAPKLHTHILLSLFGPLVVGKQWLITRKLVSVGVIRVHSIAPTTENCWWPLLLMQLGQYVTFIDITWQGTRWQWCGQCAQVTVRFVGDTSRMLWPVCTCVTAETVVPWAAWADCAVWVLWWVSCQSWQRRRCCEHYHTVART